MELRINDYVRFKTLSREIKIGKVIEIIEPDKESMKKYCVYDLDNNEATVDDYVIKSSPNIIDLIEENDFIDGMRITQIISNKNGVLECMKDSDYEFITTITNNEIKSVLTHEQFESMEYRIGE